MTHFFHFRSRCFASSRRLGAALVCVLALTAAQAQPQAEPAAKSTFDETYLSLLAHPDLSSPRSTLATLQESVQHAYNVLTKAYDEHRRSRGFTTTAEVKQQVTTAQLLLHRAIATLDLSQQPAVNREEVGTETVLLLKEILDRIPVIPVDRIPGPEDVVAQDGKAPLQAWSLPYGDIQIVRTSDGQEAGHYLFSAATVAHVAEFYNLIKGFAQRPDAPADFFEFYTLTPGHLLPPKWYLWIEDMPEWTRHAFAGQAVWQWVGLFLVATALAGIYWAVWRLPHGRIAAAAPLKRAGYRLSMTIVVVLATFFAQWLAADQLNITGWPYVAVNTTLYSIAYMATALLTYFALVELAELIIASPRIDPASIDASLLRITARVVGIVAAVCIVMYGATEVGISLYGVLAGLGVGGLALGLAARPTLENLIGGLTLYADRPVRVGDFCQFNNTSGKVEEIGLRSTRVRAPDRTLITIPNAEFSNMQIVNFSRRDQIMLATTLGLRYETTREQMREVIRRISDLLLEQPEIDRDKVRVRFREFGEYALGVEFRAFFNTTDFTHFLELQEELFLTVMKIVEDCGTAMAFPSNTTYHVTDGGLMPKPLRDIARPDTKDDAERDGGAGTGRLSGSAA